MKVETKKLEKNQIEIIVEIPLEELQPHLEHAAEHISEAIKIEGFRPGKAPYEVVKQRVGEMAMYEGAFDHLVQKTYTKAVKDAGLETVSHPKIEIIKLAPGNPIIYKATVALLPHVELGKYQSLKVDRKKTEVKEEEVEKGLGELAKMQTKEVLADRPVGKKDKVMVDMEMFLDKVPIEGGQAKASAVYMGEDAFIPGFTEELAGQKKGETREFTLKFPKEHYRKNLAGKPVEFRVTVKDVYELQSPALDDEFAKSLGQTSIAEVRNLIRKNMEDETNHKEDERSEGEALEKIVEQAKFDDIPDQMIEGEVEKMIAELKDRVARQGMDFEKYATDVLKKKTEDIRKGFMEQAVTRIKTALAMRALAKAEGIAAADEEVNTEIQKMIEWYQGDESASDYLNSLDGREYAANMVRNKKVLDFLKKNIISSVS